MPARGSGFWLIFASYCPHRRERDNHHWTMDGIHEPIWYVGIAGLGFLGFLVTFSTGNCINWAQRSDKAGFPVGYKEATNDTVKGAVSENATGQWFQASAPAFAIFAGILSIVPMSIGKPDGSQVRLIEGVSSLSIFIYERPFCRVGYCARH